jgi:hypothetical protein
MFLFQTWRWTDDADMRSAHSAKKLEKTRSYSSSNGLKGTLTTWLFVSHIRSSRVPGYRSSGPRFDSRRHQIFLDVVGLERGLLSLVRIIEELLEWKSSGSGLENRY